MEKYLVVWVAVSIVFALLVEFLSYLNMLFHENVVIVLLDTLLLFIYIPVLSIMVSILSLIITRKYPKNDIVSKYLKHYIDSAVLVLTLSIVEFMLILAFIQNRSNVFATLVVGTSIGLLAITLMLARDTRLLIKMKSV